MDEAEDNLDEEAVFEVQYDEIEQDDEGLEPDDEIDTDPEPDMGGRDPEVEGIDGIDPDALAPIVAPAEEADL